ncbi:MAG: transglutaminase-like domain-containing protein [Deltaproteobacteria bacterium]
MARHPHFSTRPSVWFGALALSLSIGARPARASKLLPYPHPKEGEWMGIYLLGHKAGYELSKVVETREAGRPVVVVTEDTTLHAKLGGATVSRRVLEERTYDGRPHGRLLRFHAVHEGDGGDETIDATCDAKGVHATIRRPGQPDERRDLPPSEDRVENADIEALAAFGRKRVEAKLFDSTELRDKDEEVEFAGEGELVAGGVTTKVLKVRVREEHGKIAAEAAIDPKDGRLLQLKFGGALLAVPEPEAVAKRLDTVDLFALTRVPIDRPLPTGKVPETIRYQVVGLPGELRLAPERQRYQDLPGGAVELTVSAALPTRTARRPETGPKEYLEATASIESKNPAIAALAKKIVGPERDVFLASQRLSSWVFQNLRKAYGVSSDRATDVLARREGDCTEHSLLFVSLARAAGIPARLVHGLVYAQGSDGQSGLFWHQWAEVYTGEWVAVDPTFGQPVADATHLELGEGDETDAVALMGQLHISVLGENP